MRSGENKAGLGARLGPSATAENVTEATLENLNALQLEARCAYQVLKEAMQESRVIQKRAFSEAEDLFELERDCALPDKVSTVLTNAPYGY